MNQAFFQTRENRVFENFLDKDSNMRLFLNLKKIF